VGSNPTSSGNAKLKMFFQLQIVSKDKKVLKNFLRFFFELQKTSSTWNVISSSNKKDVITVLKSPHVNKTAQEQFEYRTYSKFFLINSFKPSIFLLTLKKIKGLSFSGVSLKVTGLSSQGKKFSKTLSLLNPKNVILKTNYKISSTNNSNQGFTKYIQLFDCHGEILLKTKFFT
jgi:ribosomal protein S10